MPFQSVVNDQPAPGIAGDFASADPYASVIAGPGALVSGTGGVIVGNFAWVDATDTYATSLKPSNPAKIGFCDRLSNWAMITTYLSEYSGVVPAGFPITLHDGGTFWAKSSTAVAIGQKVFAAEANGAICTGAAGATIAGFDETGWYAQSICLAGEVFKMNTRKPI